MTETEALIESVVADKFERQWQRISDLENEIHSLQKNLSELRQMVEPKKIENVVDAEDGRDYSGSD